MHPTPWLAPVAALIAVLVVAALLTVLIMAVGGHPLAATHFHDLMLG